jgi:putative DNA primase/helicase
MLLSNELPSFKDSSGALASRMLMLEMTQSFLGRENKSLTGKLLGELPGILNWAIRGWKRLQDRGHFIQPESGESLLADLEDLASPIKAFVESACVIDVSASVKTTELYDKFVIWCDQQKRKAETVEHFARNLRAAFSGVQKVRHRDGKQRVQKYEGIRLMKHYELPSD